MPYVETRRRFLEDIFVLLAAGTLSGCSFNTTIDEDRQKEVLTMIENLNFNPGSELKTTLFFRKIIWEIVQVKKQQGSWKGDVDESDWYNQQELLHEGLKIIKDAGIKGGRLVIAPFEYVTTNEDGSINYNWEVLDAAIKIMQEYGFEIDLAIGPIDFPYDPGIRLPLQLEQQLFREFETTGTNHIHISSDVDTTMPVSSKAISDFSLNYTQALVERYGGENSPVNKFFIGNEWPDTHGIEGTGLKGKTLSMSEEMMIKIIEITRQYTDKKIAINTNIHPSEPYIVREKLGILLDTLGDQGILGFDTYPTREAEHQTLKEFMDKYKEMMTVIRSEWPDTELVFGEFQAELWPPDNIAGQSWAKIATEHMDLLVEYYELIFPKYIQSHMIDSEIKEVSLWGAPLLIALYMIGYIFPVQMMAAIAEKMESV